MQDGATSDDRKDGRHLPLALLRGRCPEVLPVILGPRRFTVVMSRANPVSLHLLSAKKYSMEATVSCVLWKELLRKWGSTFSASPVRG
jgi:hypothetical protein